MWVRYNPTLRIYEYSNNNGASFFQLPLDASSFTHGTIPDARLSSNVALLNVANAFTANQHINKSVPTLYTYDTSAPVDARRYRLRNASQLFVLDVINDAETLVQSTPFVANRAGDVQLGRDAIVVRNITLGGGQIAFPATQVAASGVNTLDDYKEGQNTPIDSSGAGLALTGAILYLKIGRGVLIQGQVLFPANANALGAAVGGLPYVSPSNSCMCLGFSSHDVHIWIPGTVSYFHFMDPVTNAIKTNAQMSNANIVFSGFYLPAN